VVEPADAPVLHSPVLDNPILDNPMWHALTGPHRVFARTNGHAVRYDPSVAPFAGLPDDPGPGAWADLAELLGPEEVAILAGPALEPPGSWTTLMRLPGVQMLGPAVGSVPPDPAVAPSPPPVTELGPGDVAEMLELIARTKPGPFLPRTVELGGYLGIRLDGRLVAMAGYRMHLDGFTEISAVCTDADLRGRGLAGSLVTHLVARIHAREERPFLHATVENVNAIRLYESLGFTARRTLRFLAARPEPSPEQP